MLADDDDVLPKDGMQHDGNPDTSPRDRSLATTQVLLILAHVLGDCHVNFQFVGTPQAQASHSFCCCAVFNAYGTHQALLMQSHVVNLANGVSSCCRSGAQSQHVGNTQGNQGTLAALASAKIAASLPE